MVEIDNYFQRAVALLASQFQIAMPNGDLTNFQKMLYAIITMAQTLQIQEDLLQTMRSLTTAQGVQLDGLGQILGLLRIPGQSDQSYQEALQFQVFINLSNGTPEDVIKILKYLTNASDVWYGEVYPAAYFMTTNGLNFPPNPSDLVGAIQSVSPAAVNFIGVTATYNTNPFAFSSDPNIEQFFVSPVINDPSIINPFQVNPGSGAVNFYVNAGNVSNPNFGGHFSEAILISYPNYSFDNVGAGQMTEEIMTNGNIPPTP